MLTTIWLILGALSYAAIIEHAGYLARIIEPLVTRAKSTGALIASVIGTAIGLNILAGDQYVAIVMPSRVYRLEFARRGLTPRMLSRAVEDSGTVTSPLVPWNSCGAYMAGVLGVATIAYLPFCFFNLASPLISLVYGFTGFRIEHLPAAGPAARRRRRRRHPRRPDTDEEGPPMTSTAAPIEGNGPPEPKRGSPPAIRVHDPVHPDRRRRGADLDHPRRRLRPQRGRHADPRDVPPGRAEPGPDHRRLADGADQRACTASRPRTARSRTTTRASCSARSTSPCSSW